MGVNFRGKGYVKSVRIGKRTVKEGEAAAVWDQNGKHTEVVGPKLQRLWWSTIRFLELHIAQDTQYLRIRLRDGTVQHVRGPTKLYENPVYHLGVDVQDAIPLRNESCHLVVRRVTEVEPGAQSPKGESASSQLIISGPKVFFRDPADVVRKFSWTEKGAGVLEEDGRVLNVRATLQRALECTVQSGDAHSVTINVTLSARVLGLKEVMAVPDPVAECDAAVAAAVRDALGTVHLASEESALQALVRAAVASKDFTGKLDTSLRQRAGCEFVALAVKGVKPSEEFRRVLARKDELAEASLREQKADAVLDAAAARQQREQQMEAAKQKHELKLAADRAVPEHSGGDDDVKRAVEFLKELKGMKVDLDEFLCSQKGVVNVEKPRNNYDKTLDGAGNVGGAPLPQSIAAQAAKKAGLGWW